MTGHEDASYRLALAQGFLTEAQQDVTLSRWRSAVDNAQLAVENAAKAVLALMSPVGKTHHPAAQIRLLLGQKGQSDAMVARMERLAEMAELLGPDVHAKTDYGDEKKRRTPWEIFGEGEARKASALAVEAVDLARHIITGTG